MPRWSRRKAGGSGGCVSSEFTCNISLVLQLLFGNAWRKPFVSFCFVPIYIGSQSAQHDIGGGGLWLTGEQMKDALHASLLQKCNEHNELEEMSKAWQDFTSNILRSPEVLALGKISAFALGQKLGLGQEQVHSHLMAELVVELAVDAGKLNTRDEGDPKWLQEEFPSCDVIKVAFYLQKQTQDKSAKALRSLETMKRKCGLVQKSQTNKKLRAIQALEKAVAKLDPDPDTVEQQLALRNVRNRARTGAKKEKKKRSFDEAFKTAEPKVKRAARISIFQKVQIVDFAENLLQTQKPISQGRRKRKAKPTAGKHHVRVNFLRGVNLQRACQQKFPQLGRIKVSALIKQCHQQSWRSLSKAQQVRWCQLPDNLKASMGLTRKVKGWKALTPQQLSDSAKEKGYVQRWAVPGAILEDQSFGN